MSRKEYTNRLCGHSAGSLLGSIRLKAEIKSKMFALLERNSSQHEFHPGLYSSLFLFEF